MRRGPTTRPFDSGWATCFRTLEVREVHTPPALYTLGNVSETGVSLY